MMSRAGALMSAPKRASERAIDQPDVLARTWRAFSRSLSDSTRASMRRRDRRLGSGQGLLKTYQVFEPLGHGQAAADHVVHDGDGLGVVLGIPGLLEGPDDLGFVVLLAQQAQVDPLVVGLHDALVLVPAGLGASEA